jgi:hypothetical protein
VPPGVERGHGDVEVGGEAFGGEELIQLVHAGIVWSHPLNSFSTRCRSSETSRGSWGLIRHPRFGRVFGRVLETLLGGCPCIVRPCPRDRVCLDVSGRCRCWKEFLRHFRDTRLKALSRGERRHAP